MPQFDLRRDGPVALVILAIVAVALSIFNYRLSRAQLQNQVVKARYELQALQQAMDAYSIESPQAPLLEIILKAKLDDAGYVHQGFLIKSATGPLQLLPKDSLGGFVYPMPMPALPIKQTGTDYQYELVYGVISNAGRSWRLKAQESGAPLQCASLGDHNLAESSFHVRFQWPGPVLHEQGDSIVGFSPGPYVDYTNKERLFAAYDPTNGLASHGFLIVR